MEWSNSKAVLRDLSLAQGGRHVPVDILGITAGLKPPCLEICEETEEEFFKDYVKGTQNDNILPNLHLIKEMLEVVQNEDDLENNNPHTVLQISKLSATAPEYQPRNNLPEVSVVNKTCEQTCNVKKRKGRNMVLTSLLSQDKESDKPEVSIKLIKPADFMEPVTKINEQLCIEANTNMSMFRKKSVTPEMKLVGKTENELPRPNMGFKSYVPSSYADEYYNKYVERNKIKHTVQGDIWTKAEIKMKQIDEKRKLEQELQAFISSFKEDKPTTCDPDCKKFLKVSLPKRRHLLPGPCVVCEVLCKRKSKDLTLSSWRSVPGKDFIPA